jgi:predicted nuclease with TOPRIM domain
MTTTKAVTEIRQKLETQSERLARMEERQVQLYKMVETSLSNFAELSNKVNSLEALKHKALGMMAIIGVLAGLAWDLVKQVFSARG